MGCIYSARAFRTNIIIKYPGHKFYAVKAGIYCPLSKIGKTTSKIANFTSTNSKNWNRKATENYCNYAK